MSVNIEKLSLSQKAEIANYIKEDTLKIVNQKVNSVKVRKSFYTCFGKRFLDIIISFIILTLTLPVNLILAIVTFFDVGMPIIFCQKRVGKDSKQFTLYKFRNMTNEKDTNGELLPSSLRVTKWGKFVRKTSLDELLNFVSILLGDMSLIGPRPLLDYYVHRFNDFHKMIYKVRPGLECPPLQKTDHALSWQERLDNYVWYTENCSFLLDLRLTFRIIQIAFDRKNMSKRASAENGGFMGYSINGDVIDTTAVPEQYAEKFLRAHQFNNINEAVNNRYFQNN